MRRTNLKQRSVISVLCLLSMAMLSACGDGSSSATKAVAATELNLEGLGGSEVVDSLQSLYAAALENSESKVTVYGPSVGEALAPMWEGFEERFPGIKVKGVPIFGADLDARLTQEFTSKNREGDLLYTGIADVSSADARGWMEPFTPSGAEQLDDNYVGQDEKFIIPSATLYAPMYNTNLIKEAPKSWADLLDERFKGELTMSDPTEANGSSLFLSGLLHNDVIDEAWLERLVNDQELVLGPPSASGTANTVVTGGSGLLVGVGAKHYLTAKGKGAPVGFATGLTEGHFMLGYGAGLLQEAPNPNAAKLLETWLLTTEGQEKVATTSDYGTMPGAPAPEGLPETSSFTVLLNPPVKQMDEIFPQHLELFRKLMR